MKNLMKVLTALAAIAGVVYVVATYGDQIVQWAKKILASLPKCPCCEVKEEQAPVEESDFAEETPAEEPVVEEAAPIEIVIEENEPVADEADFEG